MFINKNINTFYLENKELVDNLTEKVEPLFTIIKNSLSGDKEPKFLENNKNKKIVLNFVNGKSKEGNLLDISSYGIIIKVDDYRQFYYKHGIQSYYIDED